MSPVPGEPGRARPLPAYPYRAAIEHLTGRSLGDARAVVDPARCAEQGVPAFTVGDVSYFASETPDLRVAAHEAAHVLQHTGQTADAGLGAERHADAVADAVEGGGAAHGLIGDAGQRVEPATRPYTTFSKEQQDGNQSLGWQSVAGLPISVSQDGGIAIQNNGQLSKVAWGTPEMIAAANDILIAQSSKVRMAPGGTTVAGTPPRGEGAARTLHQLVLTDEHGEPLKIGEGPGECSKAMHEVLGSSKLDGKPASSRTRGQDGRDTYTDPRRFRSGTGGRGTGAKWWPTVPETFTEQILRKEYPDVHDVKELYRLYAENKATIAAKYGLDEHASPEVGQGLVITNEPDTPGFEKNTNTSNAWNFHHASCVLREGSDYLTLENYTGLGEDGWYFQLYGPGAQSFHRAQLEGGNMSNVTTTHVVEPAHRLAGTVKDTARLAPQPGEEGGIEVPAGTPVRVLERRGGHCRVVVTEGTHDKATGWIEEPRFAPSLAQAGKLDVGDAFEKYPEWVAKQ